MVKKLFPILLLLLFAITPIFSEENNQNNTPWWIDSPIKDVVFVNLENVKEELGDLFLHLIFYSKIAEEKSVFNVADVLNQQCDKLILIFVTWVCF